MTAGETGRLGSADTEWRATFLAGGRTRPLHWRVHVGYMGSSRVPGVSLGGRCWRAGREETEGRGGARLPHVNAMVSALRRGAQPPTLGWSCKPAGPSPVLLSPQVESNVSDLCHLKLLGPEGSLLWPDWAHGPGQQGLALASAPPLSPCPQASKPSGWP